MDDAHTDELIQKLLDRELTPEEATRLRKRMETDPQFAEEVQRHLDLVVALKAEAQLTQELSPLLVTSSVRRRQWLLAASILLFLGVMGWWLTRPAYQYQNLALAQFEDRRIAPLQSRNAEGKMTFQQPLAQLREQSLRDSTSAQLNFICADRYLQNQQADSAIFFYQRGLERTDDNTLSRWNLAQAWLLAGNVSEAEKILRALQAGTNPRYASKATDLLKRLQSFAFRFHLSNLQNLK